MEQSEKLSLVQQFESSILTLIDFVKSTSAAAIDFRPDLPGAWTIRDHAVHFLDADTFAYGRIRLAVAQPGTEVLVWDEEAFAQRCRYQTADALACLETARALRHVAAALARDLVAANWEDYYVRHPARGRMSLADLLRLYTDHVQFHLGYFQRNLAAHRASEQAKT